MAKLTSDVDNAQIKRIFEILKSDSQIFDGLSVTEVEELQEVMRVVNFAKGDCIAAKGEPVDFFGFVAYGKLRVGKNPELTPEQQRKGQKIHFVEIGDMIGH